MTTQPKSETLRKLYWREEILQVMFWIKGEGFGEEIDATTLERFLGVEAAVLVSYLEQLAADGYLQKTSGGGFRLSDIGHEQGGRIFSDEFADLTRPGHGECGPDCWCHTSVEEALACAEERAEAGA